MANFLRLAVFQQGKGKKVFDTLISAYSFEDRMVDSLERSLQVFDVRKVVLLVYDGETYLDNSTLEKWRENKKKIDNVLALSGIPKTVISCRNDDVTKISRDVFEIIQKDERVLIDITGLTKNYILKLAQILCNHKTSFLYTRSEGYRVPTKEEMSVSINRIEPIDGFEGYVSIDKNDLVVLILGYEGNRSLAFLKKFDTEPVFAIIGIPCVEKKEINDSYYESAKLANKQLLSVHRVARYEKPVHSLDPFLFAADLEVALKEYPGIEKYNICISCLGTKLQTLGLYLYWKKKPQCQIWYAIPNRRFDISSGAGESWIIEFESPSQS